MRTLTSERFVFSYVNLCCVVVDNHGSLQLLWLGKHAWLHCDAEGLTIGLSYNLDGLACSVVTMGLA